jgi:hypothetical protein
MTPPPPTARMALTALIAPFALIALLIAVVVLRPLPAAAQDDDFFIDDGAYEDSEEFDGPYPPDDFNEGNPGGFVPPPNRGGAPGSIPGAIPGGIPGGPGGGSMGGGFRGGGGGGGSARPPRGESFGGSGAVEFFLMDPPMVRVKKQRPFLPKPR